MIQKMKAANSLLNPVKRDGKVRHLGVLVNPISGKKQSRNLWQRRLEPMLKIANIKYTMVETTSATFVNEWVGDLRVESLPFTEFVLVGGDGLFSQFANAIWDHM